MTRKPAWRYTCDFCGKHGYSGGHVKRHEASCTANPDRVCRMHKYCENPQKPIAQLIAVLAAHKTDQQWASATEELRSAADGCPVCMLAAIRQSGLQFFEIDEEGISRGADFGFDFKAECKSFWDTINGAAYEEEHCCYGYY